MKALRIKLTQDVPVEDCHGMLKGKTYEVLEFSPGRSGYAVVKGDTGQKVKVWAHEFEVIEK